MDELELLIDLHKDAERQGPGSDEMTLQALEMACLGRDKPLHIADIGCGTGASTRVLAQVLNAQITAIDFLQPFLDVLERKAKEAGVAQAISPLCVSMDDLPFAPETLDVIWSEGAIYNLGFEKGIREWRSYLKPNGVLVASEISWLTSTRPTEIEQHWQGAYPEIDTVSAKLAQLEANGYSPLGYFVLPESCWLEHYYRPMMERFAGLLDAHEHSAAAVALVEAEKQEIALYEKYKAYYGYGMYIARKVAAP